MKIAIGVPTNRSIRPLTAQSLLLTVSKNKDIDFEFIIETRGATVEDNRNYIVDIAQQLKADYLLFVDDDMVFDPDLLPRMLSHNKDVVGVKARNRHSNEETVVSDDPRVSLFESEYVGTGVLLIKMSVFDKLELPYFQFKRDKDGWVTVGEDYHFCEKLKEKDVKIYVDGSVKVKHIGDYFY